jgi:hypothetical protein
MKMKKFVLAATVIMIVILLMLSFMIPLCSAQVGNSQDFTPSRYVIVAAQVNVSSPQMGGLQNTQYVIVKLDTVTGKSWILQLDVAGGNDPKVNHSMWKELGSGHR